MLHLQLPYKFRSKDISYPQWKVCSQLWSPSRFFSYQISVVKNTKTRECGSFNDRKKTSEIIVMMKPTINGKISPLWMFLFQLLRNGVRLTNGELVRAHNKNWYYLLWCLWCCESLGCTSAIHDRKCTYSEQCCEFVLRLWPLSLLPDHITEILKRKESVDWRMQQT